MLAKNASGSSVISLVLFWTSDVGADSCLESSALWLSLRFLILAKKASGSSIVLLVLFLSSEAVSGADLDICLLSNFLAFARFLKN